MLVDRNHSESIAKGLRSFHADILLREYGTSLSAVAGSATRRGYTTMATRPDGTAGRRNATKAARADNTP